MELFGTAGIRGDATEVVDPELAVAVGRAAALEAGGGTFALGYDGRITSPGLAAAVEAGLESGGATVERVGQVPTPALAYASRGQRGVMITASHNPPADNGIKLFVDGVEYDSERERRIESLVDEAPGPAEWVAWGDGRDRSVLETYREAVVEYVVDEFGARPLEGLRVVVDCGNGVGGLATPQVLRSLGATPVALDASVDGYFPSRESKPTPESLSTLRSFVAGGGPTLGLAHDGDADRLVVVRPDGEVVHEDTVLAVVAEHYARTSDADEPVVVTTPNASARIDERVREGGGRVERTALGQLHEGIARVREADAGPVVFAAEPWKHVHPRFGGWIDGVVSAAVVAALVVRAGGVEPLRERVTERPYRKENVRCPDDAKADAMDRLERTLPRQFPDGDVDTEYGVRIERPDGSWLLVRPSGTEPYVRLYAESDDVDDLVDEARETIEAAVDAAT